MEKTEKYTIALAQINPEFLQVERNLHRAEKAIREAAENGARLICFPEAFLTGYQADRMAEACALAEPGDRPNIARLCKVARQCGVYLLMPFLEKCTDGVYNSAILVNDRGEETGTYSKIHLVNGEKSCMLPGDRFALWDTRLGRIGCLICYDICFPETVRYLALAGAQLILIPAAWGVSKYYREWWNLNTACRALDNLVFIAAVNRSGKDGNSIFSGCSKVCDPVGRVIGQCGEDTEETLYVDIDLNRISAERAENTVLEDMRPELYGLRH